ncbi:membrane protein [Atlantibacter hermannii]|nr:membrane protein [Atlantibacter hermannii]
MQVDNLTAHLRKEGTGWQLDIPRTNITMDDTPWPAGALTLAWLPAQEVGGADRKTSDELRIRANNLELQGLKWPDPDYGQIVALVRQSMENAAT